MISLEQNLSRPRRRLALAIACAGLAAGVLATSFVALAQDQSAATVKDVIFARKTMMDTLSDNMDQIEGMISTGKIDIADAHEHADTISVMLMAFPHLFPPATNQWKPGANRDPATDTFASPDLWSNFADFYQRATEASKLAWSASRAKRADEFRPLIGQLRQRCNACHALNLKTE
jgi:cytochrome c556